MCRRSWRRRRAARAAAASGAAASLVVALAAVAAVAGSAKPKAGGDLTGLSERTERVTFEGLYALSSRVPAELRRTIHYWISCLHDAHATITWLAIVSATRLVLDVSNTRLDDALLRTVSTNLDNLKAHPTHVLITSACFIQQAS